MVAAITINISLSQIAIFFTVVGAGTIAVSALLLDDLVQNSKWSSRNKGIGVSSVVIVGAVVQTLSSIVLYFKGNLRQTWIYIQVGLILLFVVCFSLLLADRGDVGFVSGAAEEDAFFAILGINWILLFFAVGLLSKNSVPVGIFFAILGIAVIISCSLVLDDFAGNGRSSTRDKIIGCSATALIAGFAQTFASGLFFFKEDMKAVWIYTNSVVILALVICFSVPLAGGVKSGGRSSLSYYYSTLSIDFIFLFVVVGMFMKNKFYK